MELQDTVVDNVFLCTSCPLKYWIAVAVAVAELPLLLSMKNDHKTIVIASHNAEDIQVLCDEVYEMENGKLEVNSIKQQI